MQMHFLEDFDLFGINDEYHLNTYIQSDKWSNNSAAQLNYVYGRILPQVFPLYWYTYLKENFLTIWQGYLIWSSDIDGLQNIFCLCRVAKSEIFLHLQYVTLQHY